MSGVELHPVDGAGVEVDCGDLTELGDSDFEQLESAFRDHGLLYFREQYVTDDWLVSFAERWGSPRLDHGAGHSRPEIGVHHRSRAAVSDPEGRWRADGSFEESPPGIVLSIARIIPLAGGATRFADTAAAYDALDSATRRHLEGLQAVHRSADGAMTHTHPLVIRHPISGRSVLFVNPSWTTEVVGVEPTESLALLNQLFAHCTSPDFVHTFDWEPGSIVVRDNRSIIELEPHDHPGQERTMHRVSLVGEPITPAASPTSTDPTLAQRAGTTVAGAVVTAAMLGLGQVIEPEKARPDIEITAEAPEAEPLDSLDFGSLPPLD